MAMRFPDMLFAACVVVMTVAKSITGFPSQNTPPVFDFKREWLIPENEAVGEHQQLSLVNANGDSVRVHQSCRPFLQFV